jgi:hypothetical protein
LKKSKTRGIKVASAKETETPIIYAQKLLVTRTKETHQSRRKGNPRRAKERSKGQKLAVDVLENQTGLSLSLLAGSHGRRGVI